MCIKHKNSKGNNPFIFMTFEEVDIDKILELLMKKVPTEFTCHYCSDVLTKNDLGGVFPGDSKEIIFLCKSIVCHIEYFEDYLVDIKEDNNDNQ